MRSTRPAAISAWFSDRLPCDRIGTSDSCLSRLMTSTASPLTTVASGQSSGSSRVLDTTVVGRLLIRLTHGSPTPDSSVAEPLGALLAPVAAPVAVVGAVAVERGKDVEGIGRGHSRQGSPAINDV